MKLTNRQIWPTHTLELRPLMNLPNSCTSLKRSDDVLRLATFHSHNNLRDEAELITLKWPAYRFLSPWRCNLLFRDAYNAQIAAMSPRNGDGSLSYLGGISGKLDMRSNNSAHTQLHLARQHADRTGMPYDEYLRFCFDFASRRTRDFVPRPNQLRPNPKSEAAWSSSIVEYWTADRMYLSLVREPHLPQFSQENGRDLPAQTSFTETLIWLAGENLPGLSTLLGNFVLSRRWMPEHIVAHRFPLALEKANESPRFYRRPIASFHATISSTSRCA
ncbi:MAG: hypothetical protein ACSHX3_16880 [Litorimonas sp.]